MHKFNKFSLVLIISLFAFLNLSAQGSVSVSSTNSDSIGIYNTFEILAALENIVYDNAYDPDEVDLRGAFISPTLTEWDMFGYYDNYLNQDNWKIKFAPNELGTWTFSLRVTDANGTFSSENYSFEVVESEHHGWLKTSENNPHYFEHDDGTSFYGVGVYYPWSITNSETSGLGVLEESGCNIFGYWNITWDNDIIESLSSGLGKYDQESCKRIDNILDWAEDRDMMMMLAIWPHDLLSETVWSTHWENNPYNTITTAAGFYSSEDAWIYQEKQYRYIIARWGSRRGLAIWEIVNEINGTDGGDTPQGLAWTERVHNYLKSIDPYQHPTTASKSGGRFWTAGYEVVDIPNIHVYENQFSSNPYPDDPLRSSYTLYHNISNYFWNGFEKPAMMGEAGFEAPDDIYGDFSHNDFEYTILHHNAIWTTWASGNAITPMWWDFTRRDIITDERMEQLKYLSEIASTIDYTNDYLYQSNAEAFNCDAIAMAGDTLAFGWMRDIKGDNLSSDYLLLEGLSTLPYSVNWINPWTGEDIASSVGLSVDETIVVDMPDNLEIADITFIVRETESGGEPERIALRTLTTQLIANDSSIIDIVGILKDSEGLISFNSTPEIEFTFTGPVTLLGDSIITADKGHAKIQLESTLDVGVVEIIASSPGLISDTVTIDVYNQLAIDNFDSYTNQPELEEKWTNTGSYSIGLDNTFYSSEENSMKIDYGVGSGYSSTSEIVTLVSGDYTNMNLFKFWINADGSNRALSITLYDEYPWTQNFILSETEAQFIELPIANFSNRFADEIDLSAINKISLKFAKATGEDGAGEIYIDDITFAFGTITSVDDKEIVTTPQKFELGQNYPNPFNPTTTINYNLPSNSIVKLIIYDILGREVATLINKQQSAGTHQVQWNASGISSGLYFYHLNAGEFNDWKKMILLK